MKTASEWKRFYAEERAALDLDALLERARARSVRWPVIFPHTKLRDSPSGSDTRRAQEMR